MNSYTAKDALNKLNEADREFYFYCNNHKAIL